MAKDRKNSTRQTAEDERLRRSPDAQRMERSAERVDQMTTGDGLVASPEDRARQLLNVEGLYEALPRSPEIPGYHTCWLTTTSLWDPIHKRMRLGYEPVRAEDVPGFEHLKMQSGQWEGCVGVNEMLLFKIPEDLYQALMAELHHIMPSQEEERLRTSVEQMAGERYRGKQLLFPEDGYLTLGRAPKKPTFS